MPRLDPKGVRWGPLEVTIGLGLYCLMMFLCWELRAQDVWASKEATGRSFLFHLVQDGTLVLLALVFVVLIKKQRALRLWFPTRALVRDIAIGLQLALIFAMLRGIAIRQMLAGRGPDDETPLPGIAGTICEMQRLRDIVLAAVAVGVIAPIAEELFFRGFVYPGLRKQFGMWPSVLMSSAFFAIFHIREDPLVLAYPFLLGMMLALIYEFSSSLVAPILAHAAWNLSLVFLLGDDADIGRAIPLWLLVAGLIPANILFFFSSKHLFSEKLPASPPGAERLFRVIPPPESGDEERPGTGPSGGTVASPGDEIPEAPGTPGAPGSPPGEGADARADAER